jgi:HPr kinase/phosphorylase
VVRCDWSPPGIIFGQAAELLRHHIEIRGLGVLDLRALFGITAVRGRKRIDLVVHLCEWNDKEEFDRLGLQERFYSILGTPVRELRVPVRPGRNMSSLIEMAARNELLRYDGHHTANEFLERIEAHLISRPAVEEEPITQGSSRGPDRLERDSPTLRPTEQPPDPRDGDRPSPLSWTSIAPQASTTESSAWVRAVRPPSEEAKR